MIIIHHVRFNWQIRSHFASLGCLSPLQVCCSKEKKPCKPESQWIPAPMKEWASDYVLVSIAECPQDNVAALRYAWSDWSCAFKACPIYSVDGILPAPLFIVNRWQTHTWGKTVQLGCFVYTVCERIEIFSRYAAWLDFEMEDLTARDITIVHLSVQNIALEMLRQWLRY